MPLSTHSNEAAKLYDAAISQYVGWYDDANLGGLAGSLERMISADPTFGKMNSNKRLLIIFTFNVVGGRALSYGLQLTSTAETTRIDKKLEQKINELAADSTTNKTLNYREKKHVEAVVHWSKGELHKAALSWEDVLLQYPTDMLALKMASDTYFFLGKQEELRDSVARVLPFWTSRAEPLKAYLHGLYAFGLVETNFYAQAETEALKVQ